MYILTNLAFAAGLRIPYSRVSDAVLNFLREVCEAGPAYLPGAIILRHLGVAGSQPDPRDHRRALGRLADRLSDQLVAQPAMALELQTRAGWARAGSVAAVVLVADQVTKQLVRQSIAFGSERHLLPGLTLVRAANRGIAFSLFPGLEAGVIIVALVVVAAVIAFFATHRRPRAAVVRQRAI